VSTERLDNLTGLVEVGGDALADSEALGVPLSAFSVFIPHQLN